MRGKSVLVALTVGLVSQATFPADKTPVYIEGVAHDDGQSRTFLFEVKEQFRSSASMRIAGSMDDAFYVVRLSIMHVAEQNGIAYSVVWTHKIITTDFDTYSSHAVGVCPDNQLQVCARSVLSLTADEIERTAEMEAGHRAVKAIMEFHPSEKTE